MLLERNIPLSKQLGKSIFILSIGEWITKRTGFYYGNEREESGKVCLTCSCNGRCDSGPVPAEPGEDVRALCWGRAWLDGPCPSTGISALLLSLYVGQALLYQLICTKTTQLVSSDKNWAQASSSLNLDTRHLEDCWKF